MLCVSIELSSKTWLVTSLAPGSDKMSKHKIEGGDHCSLLDFLQGLQSKAVKRLGAPVRIVTIQEAGFDGFWLDRLLQAEGIESHVVDPASVAVPRRHRRAKTDKIDGKLLLQLRSIGKDIASVLWLEGFYCHFDNPPLPAPACQTKRLALALKALTAVLPIAFDHGSLEQTSDILGLTKLEQIRQTFLFTMAHHRLIAEAVVTAKQARPAVPAKTIQERPQARRGTLAAKLVAGGNLDIEGKAKLTDQGL